MIDNTFHTILYIKLSRSEHSHCSEILKNIIRNATRIQPYGLGYMEPHPARLRRALFTSKSYERNHGKRHKENAHCDSNTQNHLS